MQGDLSEKHGLNKNHGAKREKHDPQKSTQGEFDQWS